MDEPFKAPTPRLQRSSCWGCPEIVRPKKSNLASSNALGKTSAV